MAVRNAGRCTRRKPGPSHLQSDWHKALPVLVHLARSLISPHQSADVMVNGSVRDSDLSAEA